MRKMDRKMNGEKIYFLNVDLGANMTGIEHSSLMRARLFSRYLDKPPVIVTSAYNASLNRRRQDLYDAGMLPRECPVVNLYELWQETQPYQGEQPVLPLPAAEEACIKPVEGTYDLRIYNEKNTMIMYRKCSAAGEVEYDNIFANRKKVRKDFYDCNGCLSKIQNLDPETSRITNEQYFRTDGTVCMYKYFVFEDGKNKPGCIYLVDKQNRIIETFFEEDQFVAYCLNRLTAEDEKSIFLIDKERVYYSAAKSIRTPRHRIICAIHSTHLAGEGDPMTGMINSNYKAIFDDLSVPDAVVVLSNKQKNHVQARFGFDEKIYCIPHATEQIAADVDIGAKNRNKVIFLARYAPEKQHILMVDIFKEVVKECPEAQLAFYGSGGLKESIIRYVEETGMEKHITVNGYVDDKEKIYREGGMSVLPSRAEGFSLFLLESLLYGCPIVSFDMKYGPDDVVDHGGNGYLVELNDSENMKRAIVTILKDADLMEKMSNAAMKKVQKFTMENVAKKWRILLDDIK